MTAYTTRGSTKTQVTSLLSLLQVKTNLGPDTPFLTLLVHPTPVQGVLRLYRIRDSSRKLTMKADNESEREALQRVLKSTQSGSQVTMLLQTWGAIHISEFLKKTAPLLGGIKQAIIYT